ncbi:MAG TPA: 2-succinyl-5-enolpyruvyl-6-hydroxy-3-cyclohexene-1-carboxylic-acid synthase [Solirubrobacteraceae bacterium]|nr:2-succinyl-5-enolpyruvyl-6-hydroxy-3-cyclohexene-1-carboxylic-acid synthase [Solirubrobacteraceae bacterium]
MRAFVDELARCGMRHACTSPGSRSTPLVISLAREPRLRCHSHVDERCAGFFALGLAKRSGLPAAVACTSGTAVAELGPAVIEAREARVPLLVLSADRPAELREVGAGQAIDQLKLFGSAAKWFFEVSLEGGAGPGQLRFVRTLACRAYWTALEGRPGAVHLNFPLREPLIGEGELPEDASGRPGGQPYVRRSIPVPASADAERELGELVRGSRRGLLVAGRDERGDGLAAAAAAFAQAAGWPLLGDPLSGARRGDAAVAHYDALLRDGGFAAAHEPDLVVRVGDLPVSKPLRTWLAGLDGIEQVALDPEGAWQDPSSVLSRSLALDPTATLAALTQELEAGAGRERGAERDWLAGWRGADELAAQALLGVLDGHQVSEPAVAAELGTVLPGEATLFVASSMPVRDIESFWPVRQDPPRVLCNRGANGIDGTVSSAFGAAAAGGGPVVLLIGDVALAHDIGGLLAARRLGLALTIVLLDNGGGGIFDFLPVAGIPEQELYETHVATPTGLDFARAAELYGLGHELAGDIRGLRAALERSLAAPGSTIVEVKTERAANVGLHRRLWEATAAALSPQAAGAGPAA